MSYGIREFLNSSDVKRTRAPRPRGLQRLAPTGWAILAVLSLFFPPSAGAQDPMELEGREIFTSSDLEILNPSLSPDGRWIAFAGQSSPDRSSLYLIPADGGSERDLVQLTHGNFTDKSPTWAPDSRFLFFFSDRIDGPESGSAHVMRMPFDPEAGQAAGTIRPISLEGFHPSYNEGPVVSPNGEWIAYAVDEPGPKPNVGIRVIPARGGESRELARIPIVFAAGLGWSSDSKYVLWDNWRARADRLGGVHRVPLEGGEPEQVIPDEYEKTGTLVGFSGNGQGLLWSRGSGFEMSDLDHRITSRVTWQPGAPRPRFISHDGSSLLAMDVEREEVLVAQPLDGAPPRTLMTGPCPLEPTSPTDDGRFFVYAWVCKAGSGDSSGASPSNTRNRRFFLVDPKDGSVEDVSTHADVLARSWLMAIHPSGRFVLSESAAPDRDPGSRDRALVIVDLESGAVQTVDRTPNSIFTLGGTLGHSGFHTNGTEAHVFGDRYIYHAIQDGSLHLMSVRPGEDPERFWTLPEDIITRHETPGPGQAPVMGDPVGIQGDLIAWVRTNYEGEITTDTRSTLMVSNASTGRSHEVAALPGYLSNPYWSRNGEKIALQYRPVEGEKSTFAVFELDEGSRAVGNHLTLNTGMTDYASLVGWSAGDEAVIFLGSGIEALEDRGILSMRLDPEAVPVNLTSGESDPVFGVLSADGSVLMYSATRTVGNTLVRYDIPPSGGGPGH